MTQPAHIAPASQSVEGMYADYFLDYASYVILERAVPKINDGFKPVQRRILHAMDRLDDGRYSKVANIVGDTMKFHPHGDRSIADALVGLGQKGLLIDTQGNWGNILTGIPRRPPATLKRASPPSPVRSSSAPRSRNGSFPMTAGTRSRSAFPSNSPCSSPRERKALP